jgi:hypothetical protein
LGAGQAGTTRDQPTLVGPESGFGDLGVTAGGVIDVGPRRLVDAVDRRFDLLGLADGDGVAHVVVAARSDDLVRPEP